MSFFGDEKQSDKIRQRQPPKVLNYPKLGNPVYERREVIQKGPAMASPKEPDQTSAGSSMTSLEAHRRKIDIQVQAKILKLQMEFDQETLQRLGNKYQDDLTDEVKTRLDDLAENIEDWNFEISSLKKLMYTTKEAHLKEVEYHSNKANLEKEIVDLTLREEQVYSPEDVQLMQRLDNLTQVHTNPEIKIRQTNDDEQKRSHNFSSGLHFFSTPKGKNGDGEKSEDEEDDFRDDGMPNLFENLTRALTTAISSARGPFVGDKDLPSFDGSAQDWPIFIGEYNRTTDMYNLNDVQNAIRLRKSLQGQAREVVIGLLYEPKNVKKAITLLTNRFGRSEFVLKSLMQNLRQTGVIRNGDPMALIKFGTQVQNFVEGVRSVNDPTYLNNIVLLDELVAKLPVLYATDWIQWQQSNTRRKKNLDFFEKWLEEKVGILEQLYPPNIEKESKGKSTRGSASVNAAMSDEPNKPPCLYCEKGRHKTFECYGYKKIPLEEKWEFVKSKKICFCCLSDYHQQSNCKEKKECGTNGCQYNHHPTLHSELTNKSQAFSKIKMRQELPNMNKGISASQNGEKEGNISSSENSIGSLNAMTSMPLSIVPVKVSGPGGTCRTFALMDSGANVTIVDENLARKLKLNGQPYKHKYVGIGGAVSNDDAMKVQLNISGLYKRATTYNLTDVITMKNLGLSPFTLKVREVKAKWPYLRRARLSDMDNIIPLLIIGEDNPHLTAHRELLERNLNEPMAKRTKLGWVVAGKSIKHVASSQINVIQSTDDKLDHLLKRHFSLEAFGVVTQTSKGSIEDRKAIEILEATTKFDGDKWETGLLWRNPYITLPQSKQQAVTRLLSCERRMKTDDKFASMYKAKIEEYKNKGYIRQLTVEEENLTTPLTWYNSHFGVTSINKPGKLRLVFDAAAEVDDISINKMLLKGPDLNNSLVVVLWNFRRHNFVITGDVEDMFHRVFVRKQDQDSQRFVWGDEQGDKIKTFIVLVLIFGYCCSPTSAIFVMKQNAEKFVETMRSAVEAIKEDFYMDDCLSGADTEDAAIKLRNDITTVNAAGRFNTKRWLANSKTIMDTIPDDYKSKGAKCFADKDGLVEVERVLGLWWDPVEDLFTFKSNFQKIDQRILEGKRPTKREMCRLVMSLFDPLGFLANFRVKGMMMLQHCWKAGLGWDDDVTDPIYDEWADWVNTLKTVDSVKISRKYCKDLHLADEVSMHTLVDASEEGYAAVIYLRITHGCSTSVAFVAAKARVTPLKKFTIPRLELMAALLGARLAVTVSETLKVKLAYRNFWSDSKTVLLWVTSECLRYREFVANRISEIQDITRPSEWRWIPTDLNVADEATRLKKKIGLASDSAWLVGPQFLTEEPSLWPKIKVPVIEEEAEIKPSWVASILSNAANSKVPCMPRIENFSSFYRLIRTRGAVVAAVQFWKIKTFTKSKITNPPYEVNGTCFPKRKSDATEESHRQALKTFLVNNLKSKLTVKEIAEGERSCIIEVQQLSFMANFDGKKFNKTSKIWKLSPFISDDGLIRAGGRLHEAAKEPLGIKNPIILPYSHYLTDLIIMSEHIANAHQGQNTVLNNLRQKYWVINGRAAIKRVFSRVCHVCKLRNIKPYIPEMGRFPKCRLDAEKPPFTYTGVDYFGPMEVTVGRHHEKRWGALFVCMVTRAIHIEVAYGLSTDEFLLVFSRFVDCRGRPSQIHCDNGTNFVGARGEMEKELQKVDWTKLTCKEKFKGIQFFHITPHSPHQGGAWERMVQAVKKTIKATLHERYPKDQVLLTVLKGAENIVNSRPLTFMSVDIGDPNPITPNHFLRGSNDIGPSIPGEFEEDPDRIREQWKKAQTMVEYLWKRWKKDYLPYLLNRQKWHDKSEPFQVGDLVVMIDEHKPRHEWVKAVVSAVFPGADGQVRNVEVTTRDFATKKLSTWKRSVSKLCPMGLHVENLDP